MISRFGFDGSGCVVVASKYLDGTASRIAENFATCACAFDAALRTASAMPAACAARVIVRMIMFLLNVCHRLRFEKRAGILRPVRMESDGTMVGENGEE